MSPTTLSQSVERLNGLLSTLDLAVELRSVIAPSDLVLQHDSPLAPVSEQKEAAVSLEEAHVALGVVLGFLEQDKRSTNQTNDQAPCAEEMSTMRRLMRKLELQGVEYRRETTEKVQAGKMPWQQAVTRSFVLLAGI